MVWFQCEDCGDNLKKPKLPNHFRVCSAVKLSCIDCGVVFGQQTVEAHTQCISEAEKYGPKGVGKASNGKTAKPKDGAKQKPEVDINVGLSERPPWFCSLCNTKATSKQTLLLHAEGKKHRAKARGFHASKQQSTDTVDTKDVTENNEVAHLESSIAVESGDKNPSKVDSLHDRSGAETHVLQSNKKRKCDSPDDRAGAKHKSGGDVSTELNDGTLIQSKGTEELMKGWKKAKNGTSEEDAILDSTSEKENLKKKIKWKKLITSALKSQNSDAVLKLKELRKLVLKSLEASGFTADDKHQVYEMLERKLNSSSRFTVNGKYVSLVTNSQGSLVC